LTVHAPGLPLFDAPLDGNVLFDPYFLVEWKLLGRGLISATHPPRSMLHRPPVWELLSRAGVEAGVVRFDFTYPADGQASIVVSNWVGRDNWELAEVHPHQGSGLIVPESLQEELLAPFSDAVSFDERLFHALLPGPARPRSVHVALEIRMLRGSLDIDQRTFDASERVLRLQPTLQFLAVYLPGLDEVCHAFWLYRFPEEYGEAKPPAADVAEFGSVIDGYLEFLDRGRRGSLPPIRPRPTLSFSPITAMKPPRTIRCGVGGTAGSGSSLLRVLRFRTARSPSRCRITIIWCRRSPTSWV